MSIFSYISFPREVDLSGIQNKVDKTKVHFVKDIRGTELEKQWESQNGGCVSDLPDDAYVYLGDWDDFQGISLSERINIISNCVFVNQYVYHLGADFRFENVEERMKTIKEEFYRFNEIYPNEQSEKEFVNMIQENIIKMNENSALCRKQLYDTVQLNIEQDEVVEIFSEYADNEIGATPPEKERIMDLEEILASKVLNNLEENVKIIIRRSL
jgi:hypothetical protein